MSTSTNAPKEEDSSLLSPTEEPKAGSHDSSLDSATTENSTFNQQKAITEPDIEPRPAGDSIEVANKDKETEETESKDWDDGVEPVRPEQQPRGRIKPPVSGSPSPRPKPK